MALVLISLLSLAACANLGQTQPPVAATVSPNARPLACSEFKVVVGHAGKITAAGQPDVSKADVTARLALPDWEAQLRRLFGDTPDTLIANRINNAAWRALCQ